MKDGAARRETSACREIIAPEQTGDAISARDRVRRGNEHWRHASEVRIALKKLRYAVEFLADVRGRRAMADVATLKSAQDVLGDLHDLEVLIEWTRDLQASLSPPNLKAWRQLGSLVDALEDDCRRLHALPACSRQLDRDCGSDGRRTSCGVCQPRRGRIARYSTFLGNRSQASGHRRVCGG